MERIEYGDEHLEKCGQHNTQAEKRLKTYIFVKLTGQVGNVEVGRTLVSLSLQTGIEALLRWVSGHLDERTT